MLLRFAPVAVASLLMAFAGETQAAGIAPAIEIAPPPAAYGTSAQALRQVAAAELRAVEIPGAPQRRVVVSLALAKPSSDEPNDCKVDATLRDERTGAVIAVINIALRSTVRLSRAERTELAFTTVRTVARRVPAALANK
jgi:hypothetical protein